VTPRNLGDTELKRLHRTWRRRTEGRVALLLDSVQTPYNVGSIVRLAAAYRVEHLHLAGATASLGASGSRKTALGADRYVPHTTHADLAAAIDAVKDDGLRLVGIELADGAVPLHEVAFGEDVCLALGHEDRGLSPLTLAASDAVAFIPQLGKVGSLNVASAAAIALYEVRRRAWTSRPT
jgi:tRNA (guanosine-2'-O-)-methyltransferase